MAPDGMASEHEPASVPSLKRFFDRLVRRSLGDLWLSGEPVADYLAALLARFARTDQLYALRDATGQPLETVVGMLLEIECAWTFDDPRFDPFRERQVRQHIGDYTLFMTGVFRERVERIASTGWYISEGKRAYHFVSEHDRAAARESAPVFRRLAERFENYAGALDYARRVYFSDHPSHPFFRLGFG